MIRIRVGEEKSEAIVSEQKSDLRRRLAAVCRAKKGGNPSRMKYWEIIADNLSAFGWSWAVSQSWIPGGEQSELLTHIAATALRLRIQASGRTVWIDQTFLQKG